MSKFRLNRRTVLRGAGTIAIALPWMEIMEGKRAHAQAATPAKRFLGVFQPGGTVRNKYTPSGTDEAPVLTTSTILAPLEPVKDKLLLIDGTNMKSAVGEQHQAGIIAWLTGSVQGSGFGYSKDGPSIDQILNAKLSVGKKFPGGLQMAVRWGTGKAHGNLSPISCATFATDAKFSPIAPKLDPQQIFKDVFGDLAPSGGGTTTDTTAMVNAKRRLSILDHVGKKYQTLGAKLGAADRLKLEEHLTKIRELEGTIMVPSAVSTASCKMPMKVDTADYNPTAGKASTSNGSVKDLSSDGAIPKVGQFMMDMIVMALACDQTGTALMQWSDTEAKHTFPWLSLSEHHHFYQHDGGFNAPACEKICIWYSKQHLYLLQQLAKVDMGGHTLLDETVVFFGSELQDPPVHAKTNMPFILAGGGMKTGRWMKMGGTSHNGLLLGILNHFGDNRTSVGSTAHQAAAIKLT